ncbi:MAG: class I SAM-dependent methyltransferase [Alphaproteobacteria bacterium]|nr:class I SAM-dependent methyltransferase [Alphaproteobacteria bacterium]
MESDAYLSYRSAITSPTVRAVWMKAYGAQFWDDAEPPWSMATKDDVSFVADVLNPKPSSVIADLGCGAGGFGRHIVRATEARVASIDANPIAVRCARERAAEAGLQDRISFVTGDLAATGWSDAQFDGAASFDVLMFVPDKLAALKEIARVLKPGAPFAGMVFEFWSDSRSLSVSAFSDYPAAFAQAGFTVEQYEEAPDWRRLLTDSLRGLVSHETELTRELHPAAHARMLQWARTRPGELDDSRRVRFCVRRG